MPRKKKSETVVQEVFESMKEYAMNPPVDEVKEKVKEEVKEKVKEEVKETKKPVLKKIHTSATKVNVRDGANGNIVCQLPNGTPVLVEEEKDGWCKITGYVMSELIG